ncbi:hypothetical protein SDJN03_18609, partial [Cucurbita argyrosperma subsp. sororia]
MNRFLSRCENFGFGSIIASLVTAVELSTTWHRTESTKTRKKITISSETRFKSTTQENHEKRLRIPKQSSKMIQQPDHSTVEMNRRRGSLPDGRQQAYPRLLAAVWSVIRHFLSILGVLLHWNIHR